ncbi:cytochrome P450 [Choiromyces venosus 120613-1]|uniref:Cytochrome P450 n=1 Tax=Choiromyces venosus 120613-1 TaxID=1336337 RepID=A0A3N4K2G6_9PEZI|nr:cytochrome P450 [Choiromyces venosus 120613-1]
MRVPPNMISIADPDYLEEIYTRTDRTKQWLPFAHRGTMDALSNEGHIEGFESGLVTIGLLCRLPNVYRAPTCNSFVRNIFMAKADTEWVGAMRVKVGVIIDAAWKPREEAEARGEEWYLDSIGPRQGVAMLEKVSIFDYLSHPTPCISTILTADKAMSARDSDGTGLTKEEVHSECFIRFLAGQDSTAFSITSVLKLPLTNPHVLSTPLSELKTYYAEKPPSYIPPWANIQDLDTKLPYLSAVLRESLRLYPAFPTGIQRMVPPSGVTLTHDNRTYIIPGGCEIGANPIVPGRNKRIFGEDAQCFRPARWLEDSEEGSKKVRTAGLEFSAGSRV